MITVNIYYTGSNGSARKFAEEMVSNGVVNRIRKETGNNASPMMGEITKLREKYDLHMKVDRYISDDGIPESDQAFIKK